MAEMLCEPTVALQSWDCSHQRYSFGMVVVQPLCPSQDWDWDLWVLTPTGMLVLKLCFPANNEWFALIRMDQPGSWAAVRLKLQYLIPPLTVFISKGQDGVHLYACLGSVTLCYIFKEGQAVLFYKTVPTEWDELFRYLKLSVYACLMVANL